jgi:hypothetical protein
MEFVSVEVSCETESCPNNGISANTILKLTDGGELPWYVCGVCQVDLIPAPEEIAEETEVVKDTSQSDEATE